MTFFYTFALHCIENVQLFNYNIYEVIIMQKDTTISLRIDSELKAEVEEILKNLGIPMTTAITMYFSQIKLRKAIPFSPSIPAPKSYDDYTDREIYKICEDAELEHYNKKTVSSSDYKKRIKEMMKNEL